MNKITNLLKSQVGKKMIANLTWSLENEHKNKVFLSEFNFISELPKKQLELFNLIFEAGAERCKSDLAVKLIKGHKIKFYAI